MQHEKNDTLEELFKGIQTFADLSMSAETRDKLYRYNDALMQSLYSILDDSECDEGVKMQYLIATLEQYTKAMKELFPKLFAATAPRVPNPNDAVKAVVGKSDPNRFDEIEEVEKFNPYHDERGRFTTAGGYATFTIQTRDPKKQHMADAAMARERERAASAASAPENKINDPETIGGVKAGAPMSRDEANQGNANPKFNESYGYQVNCQSCVVAYEARLRGYDVQAKAKTPGNAAARTLSHSTNLAWIDPETGRPPDIMRNENANTVKRFKTWMEETIQPGERYTFEHGWKGRGNSGHIISVDRDGGGKLRFYDPQSGQTRQGADIDNYLSRTKLVYSPRIMGQKINIPVAGLLRVDNLQINPQYSDGIMEAASK